MSAQSSDTPISYIFDLRMEKQPCIYILANFKGGTLYVGVTSNLLKRVWEHKHGVVGGFTKKYRVHKLVYFEQTDEIYSAIVREKQIKKWNRQWKINLIEKDNPEWEDLYAYLVNGTPLKSAMIGARK